MPPACSISRRPCSVCRPCSPTPLASLLLQRRCRPHPAVPPRAAAWRVAGQGGVDSGRQPGPGRGAGAALGGRRRPPHPVLSQRRQAAGALLLEGCWLAIAAAQPNFCIVCSQPQAPLPCPWLPVLATSALIPRPSLRPLPRAGSQGAVLRARAPRPRGAAAAGPRGGQVSAAPPPCRLPAVCWPAQICCGGWPMAWTT